MVNSMAEGNGSTANGALVSVTDAAREKVLEILDDQNLRGRAAIRIGIQGRGPGGFNYGMALEEDGQPEAGDVVQDEGDFKLLIEAASVEHIRGATVDFVGQLMGGGFKIDNPNPVWSDPVAQSVQELLDSQINPSVASHGGHVELIDVKDNNVYVRLGGGCQGCGMVDVTLRQGIEALIRQEIPQIERVIDTTDHAGGSNPYFQPAKGGGDPAGGAPDPYYQPSKGGGGGCGAPGCGAAHGAQSPYHEAHKA
jgi:Fe/S biogenesis protein NfuA